MLLNLHEGSESAPWCPSSSAACWPGACFGTGAPHWGGGQGFLEEEPLRPRVPQKRLALLKKPREMMTSAGLLARLVCWDPTA